MTQTNRPLTLWLGYMSCTILSRCIYITVYLYYVYIYGKIIFLWSFAINTLYLYRQFKSSNHLTFTLVRLFTYLTISKNFTIHFRENFKNLVYGYLIFLTVVKKCLFTKIVVLLSNQIDETSFILFKVKPRSRTSE